MGNRVPRIRTTVSEAQLAQAIIEAWKSLFSTSPSKEQVMMVLAQNALETGHRKSMWNYNIGNITTSGKGTSDYFDDLTTNEQISKGKWEKRNLKYRAYPNLIAGARDYLKLLSGKKYAGAWEHIMNPNPIAFSKALKQIGYYTADEAPYTKQLKSLFDQFSKSKVYEEAYSGKPSNVTPIRNNMPSNQLLSTVDMYLQQVAASEKLNKQLYKKYLPLNHCTIKIQSNDVINSVEFARILCAVLDQELLASASVYSLNNNVEVECGIHGPSEECFNVIGQITDTLVNEFKKATLKIGAPDIKTNFSMNKKSSYQLMDATTASNHYMQFLSKFSPRK